MKIQIMTTLLALCVGSAGVSAERLQLVHQPGYLLAQQMAQKSISKKQAVRIAKQRVDGKVLSANLNNSGNSSHYRVKILTEKGRVKTVVVKAR